MAQARYRLHVSGDLKDLVPKDNLGLFGDMDLTSSTKRDTGDFETLSKIKRGQKFQPKQTLGLDGSLDLSRPDNINNQTPSKIKRSQKYQPKQTLNLDGSMDFPKQEKINEPNSNLLVKPPISKRQDSLGPFGDSDFSRPDSINQQSPIPIPKSPRMRAKQTFGFLDGSMDLSRPGDSINHQIPDLNTRSSTTKPLDNLKLVGDIDLPKKDHDR